MKRTIIFPLSLLFIICGGTLAYWSLHSHVSSQRDHSSVEKSQTILYEKDSITVTWRSIIEKEWSPELLALPERSYGLYTIRDGKGEPMEFTRAEVDEGPVVQTVNDRYIVMPFFSSVATIPTLYIADRTNRTILHYTFKERYLATTSDISKIVLYSEQDQSFIVLDTNGNSIQRLPFAKTDTWIRSLGTTSPDDTKIAFYTWNGQHEEEGEYITYIYDLARNTTQKIGEAYYIDRLAWKNNNAVSVFVDKEERETFKLEKE